LSNNWLTVVCIALPFLHGCVALQYSESNDPVDVFTREYGAVAFSAEGTSFKTEKLMRWCGPVSVYLPQNISLRAAKSANDTLGWLSKIDGLTITRTKSIENASLVISVPDTEKQRDDIVDRLFPGDSRTRRKMKNSTCFFEFRTTSDHCIIAGSVVVPGYHPQELQTHCMAEELVQVMGLPNDASLGPDSIFSPGSAASTASGRDRQMVQLHYSKAVRPGMEKAEVLQRLRPIAAEMVE